MANTLRTFVALPVPQAVTGFLEQIQERLRPSVANVRWVPVENVHLTLKFLGDIDPAMVPAIVTQVDAAARTIHPFTLVAKGVGGFPNRRQARVVWVGLAGDLEALESLHHNLESGLATLGFKRDHRAFRAHLTLGRMRRPAASKTLGDLLEPLTAEASAPFGVDQLRLYRSVLKPTGAEYTLLHAAHLAASGATTP